MEFEHAADEHRDQRLLHLDPVARHVTVEPVLAVELDHARVGRAHALVKAPGHVELFVHGVERVPVVRVPVVAVHEVRPEGRSDRAELPHAPDQLPAGQVHVVHGQHRDEFQPRRAVLAEVVDPVVVRLAEGQRELRIHPVAAHQGEAGGGVEHRDVDPFHRHAHDLGLGVVVALDGEVEAARVEDARAGQELRALRLLWADPLPVLLQIHVGRGLAVDDDEPRRAAIGAAVGADRHADAVLEPRVQIAVEQVRGFHDVHVGVDEPNPVLHGSLLRRLAGL